MLGPRRILIAMAAAPLLLTGLVTGLLPGTAAAATSTAQSAIDRQLAEYPGGRQISPYEVSYRNGHVIMVFRDAAGRLPTGKADRPELARGLATSSAWHGCPYGTEIAWYCFYQDRDFSGRMLEFRDCSKDGLQQSLATYGFSGEASSWVNMTGSTVYNGDTFVQVFDSRWNELWDMPKDTDNPYVGNAVNDRADRFLAYC